MTTTLPPDDPRHGVAALFARVVPEIANGTIAIRAIGRLPGVRTVVAVESDDADIDAIDVCLGQQASRVRIISAQLGEPVAIIAWSSHPDELIRVAVQPLRAIHVALDEGARRAVVTVGARRTSGVARPREETRELARQLSGWQIEIVDPPGT
jgi:N utilization substance protein A